MSAMTDRTTDTELGIEVREHVAIVEMRRPPTTISTSPCSHSWHKPSRRWMPTLACAPRCCARRGDAFCAGASLVDPRTVPRPESEQAVNPIYAQAVRLFALRKPMVAAVHGAAVGGGLGLALVADFRVTCAEARFSANFARLGITPGFWPHGHPAPPHRLPARGFSLLQRSSHRRPRRRWTSVWPTPWCPAKPCASRRSRRPARSPRHRPTWWANCARCCVVGWWTRCGWPWHGNRRSSTTSSSPKISAKVYRP